MSTRIRKTTVCLWYDHNAEDAANTPEAMTGAMAKGGEAARRAFAAIGP